MVGHWHHDDVLLEVCDFNLEMRYVVAVGALLSFSDTNQRRAGFLDKHFIYPALQNLLAHSIFD